MSTVANTSYPIAGTVVTAAQILETIGEHKRVFPQELAKELNLNRSTVHRMLYTLELLEVVRRQDDGAFRLTFHLFKLGNSVPHSYHLIDAARVDLLHLSQETGFTTNHAVLYDNMALYIDKASPPSYLHLDRTTGESEPLHCTSLGKVLLAHKPEEEQRRIVSEIDLIRLTPNTITDRSQLLDELSHVRANGYAVDNQELAMEIRCVAAPVLTDDGSAISAVSISGPEDRLTMDTVPELLPQLRSAVKRIETHLRAVQA